MLSSSMKNQIDDNDDKLPEEEIKQNLAESNQPKAFKSLSDAINSKMVSWKPENKKLSYFDFKDFSE